MSASALPPVPHNTPMADKGGVVTQQWFKFFLQLFARATQFRAGVVAIGSGVKSVTVSFSSDMPDMDYAAVGILANYTDQTPTIQSVIATAKTASGVTFSWGTSTGSANYLLEYYICTKT